VCINQFHKISFGAKILKKINTALNYVLHAPSHYRIHYSPFNLFFMKTSIRLTKWLPVLAVMGVIVFTGCKKETAVTAPDEIPQEEIAATVETAASDAQAEEQFDDVFNITASISAEDAGEELGMGTNVAAGLGEPGIRLTPSTQRCFTVTVVPNIPGVFPKTVTVDFGNGCTGPDGKVRKGKIVSIFTNRMLVPGAKVSTTFVGYYVDSLHIEGTHITENTSVSNMQGLSIKVIDGKITNTANGRWIKWNTTKNILQLEGNGTPNFPLDDVYKITGGGAGSNAAGHTWAALIADPLIKKFSCRWIVKGTVRISRNNRNAVLDYGNGRCDNLAMLYINGVGHVITL
jgi:hypothetical protein